MSMQESPEKMGGGVDQLMQKTGRRSWHMRVSRNGTSRLTHVELEMPTVLPDGPRSAKESLEWMPHIWPRMSCDQRYRLVKTCAGCFQVATTAGPVVLSRFLWKSSPFFSTKGLTLAGATALMLVTSLKCADGCCCHLAQRHDLSTSMAT